MWKVFCCCVYFNRPCWNSKSSWERKFQVFLFNLDFLESLFLVVSPFTAEWGLGTKMPEKKNVSLWIRIDGTQYSSFLAFSGDPEETEADRLLLKYHDKFKWFPHMWSHMQAHWFNNVTKLCAYMDINKQFSIVSPSRTTAATLYRLLWNCTLGKSSWNTRGLVYWLECIEKNNVITLTVGDQWMLYKFVI